MSPAEIQRTAYDLGPVAVATLTVLIALWRDRRRRSNPPQ